MEKTFTIAGQIPDFAPKKHVDLSLKKLRPEVVIPTGVMRSIREWRNLVSNGEVPAIAGQIPRLRSE